MLICRARTRERRARLHSFSSVQRHWWALWSVAIVPPWGTCAARTLLPTRDGTRRTRSTAALRFPRTVSPGKPAGACCRGLVDLRLTNRARAHRGAVSANDLGWPCAAPGGLGKPPGTRTITGSRTHRHPQVRESVERDRGVALGRHPESVLASQRSCATAGRRSESEQRNNARVPGWKAAPLVPPNQNALSLKKRPSRAPGNQGSGGWNRSVRTPRRFSRCLVATRWWRVLVVQH